VKMVVDKPFMFALRDGKTGVIAMAGMWKAGVGELEVL